MTPIIKRIDRAYPWLLLAPTVLPVAIWGSLIYPYLVPKTLLFYALSILSVSAFVLLAAHHRPFFWSRLTRPETWIPGALLVLAYIASLHGIDFYRSFWSLFIRGDGLLMLTCVVTSFYLIVLYADRVFFERLLHATAAIASFVAVYGIGEWIIDGGRIGGLLGNAAFFAGYLGVAFFATLIGAQTLPQSWRRAAYTGAILQIIAVILSATRGTMLALIVAGMVYLAYTAFSGKGKQRTASTSVLIGLVVLGGLFFTLRGQLAKVPFEPISRIASISLSDTTVSSRLFIWKNMVTEIQKTPWLGVGTEHIDVLFNRFYDPTKISESWFDRSHNAFLDYAAQYGVGGLVLYLALIVTFFISALRFFRRGEKRIALLLVLLGSAYAVQNFFVFDTISSFWLVLALLASSIALSVDGIPSEVLPLASWTRGLSWVFAFVFICFIIPASYRPALAAYDLREAYKYQLTDVSKEVKYLSSGFALGTYGDMEYGYEAYDMYTNNQTTTLSGDALAAAYQSTFNILTENFNRYTYDARTALDLAHVISLAPKGVSIDQNLLSAALARAIEESPKRSQSWYVLANFAISNANLHPPASAERLAGYAAAQDILNRYIALVPALAGPHFVLAELLLASGNTSAAKVEAEKGKAAYRPELETAHRAASYYAGVQDWKNASFFLGEVVRMAPTDVVSKYDLAKALYLSGDLSGADTIVMELRKSSPTLLETDQNFIAAITAYEKSKK